MPYGWRKAHKKARYKKAQSRKNKKITRSTTYVYTGWSGKYVY